MPAVYADECWFKVGGVEYLIIGLLISPPASSLESRLQRVRQDKRYMEEVHASNLHGNKMLAVALSWIDEFVRSDSPFRAIIVPKKEPEFTDFCGQDNWRMVSKAIHLCLTYCYPGDISGKAVKLLRPRIFLDECDDYRLNREHILCELVSQFERRDLFMGTELRRFPVPILQLVNSKSMDSLQLCDVLVASIHWELDPPTNQNKLDVLSYVKSKFGVSCMANVARWDTENQVNVWPFKDAKQSLGLSA